MSLSIESPTIVIGGANGVGLSGGGISTPPIVVPGAATITIGNSPYAYTGAPGVDTSMTQQTQNTLNAMFNLTGDSILSNAAYTQAQNAEQNNFLATANQLGDEQAQEAGSQGKGK